MICTISHKATSLVYNRLEVFLVEVADELYVKFCVVHQFGILLAGFFEALHHAVLVVVFGGDDCLQVVNVSILAVNLTDGARSVADVLCKYLSESLVERWLAAEVGNCLIVFAVADVDNAEVVASLIAADVASLGEILLSLGIVVVGEVDDAEVVIDNSLVCVD